MKGFLKMLLAVICGILIAGIILSIVFFSFMGALVSSSDTPAVPRNGVLKIDMSAVEFAEQASYTPDIKAVIQGKSTVSIGLWDAVQAIGQAAQDPCIKFIYLKTDGLSIGQAQLEELRTALARFRMSGKPVISYMEMPSVTSYYLASVADKVYMASYEGASPMILGVGSQMIFLKDLLDKIGVNVQLIRHGKYKSAGEMYIRNSPSAENLEQTQEMVNSLWHSYATDIAESREVSVDSLSLLIEDLKLQSPDDMLRYRLVDAVVDKSEIKEKIKVYLEVEKVRPENWISLGDYITARVAGNVSKARQQIAIIFADGSIVEGIDRDNIAGDRFAEIIAGVAADSSVKAVVFRVNSPGGSVLASDKIRNEIDRLREVKPVIASYGDYAASGGYWISSSCDRIFSDRTTLTGSIGVFSMIPDLSGVIKDKLHVGITTVGSSSHLDIYAGLRPLTAEELDAQQNTVEQVYEAFVGKVAEGRGMFTYDVDGIAQGRVWTGADAIDINLVDEIGGLEDAVHYAALMASEGDSSDLSAWKISTYPKALTGMEAILAALNQRGDKDGVFTGTPFESIENAFRKWDINSSDRIFARMPYEYIICDK